MNSDEYLEQLRQQLKGFSAQEKAVLLEEIRSHLDSGEGDPALGDDLLQRHRKLEAEMGSPQQMAQGFKNVHRPNRWLDFLLVIVPKLVILPLITPLLVSLMGLPLVWQADNPVLWLDIRIALSFEIVLIVLARLRNATLVMLYWLPAAIGTLASLMMREGRWNLGQEIIPGSMLESIFWYAVLACLVFWLVKMIQRVHYDPLLLVFALLPILVLAANLGAQAISPTSVVTQAGGPVAAWLIELANWLQVLWLAGFFLISNRKIRWLALAANALALFINGYASGMTVVIAVFWSILPTAVLLGWWVERLNRRRFSLWL